MIVQDGVSKKTREPTSDIKDSNSKIDDNPQQTLPTQTSPTDISAHGISFTHASFLRQPGKGTERPITGGHAELAQLL